MKAPVTDWNIPLYDMYPNLRYKVPRIRIARFPTPLERHDIGGHRIHVKNDGKCWDRYGGNKIRKFEFVMADAFEKRAKTLMTVGGTGSNHILAMAVIAREFGMDAAAATFRQPDSAGVRRKQELFDGFGVTRTEVATPLTVMPAMWSMARRLEREGRGPVYSIPGGASEPMGTLGYVNAAFELRGQLEKEGRDWPKRIYLALGSCGTTAGLLLGLSLMGAKTELHPVSVTTRFLSNSFMVKRLARGTARLMGAPKGSFSPFVPMRIRRGFFGGGYGRHTKECDAAVTKAAAGGLKLEPVYTGKAMACLLDDLEKGVVEPDDVLFWNTYSSVDAKA